MIAVVSPVSVVRSATAPGATNTPLSPAPTGSSTTVLDTTSGGAHDIQTAANLTAALTASGFSQSVGAGGATLNWDTTDTLSVPGAPKYFRIDWVDTAGVEQDLMIYKGLGINTRRDIYLQYKRFQPAGFDNTNAGAGPGGRKLWVLFRNSGSNNSRTVNTISANPGSRCRVFRDDTYTSDPTSAGDDGSRFEIRYHGSGGTSDGGTVPAPSGSTTWHPDNWTGTLCCVTVMIRPESSAAAGDGYMEARLSTSTNGTSWTNYLVDSKTGYTGPDAAAGEWQIGGPTWIGPLTQKEALFDFRVWHNAVGA